MIMITKKNWGREKLFWILSLGYALLTLMPILRQGVMLNDDLRYRLIRRSGFLSVVKTWAETEFGSGRFLRGMSAINGAFNFITENTAINRWIQVFILLLSIYFFGKLIKELTNSKKIAYITMAFIVIFLPVTVEHAVPNAFIGLCCIPIMCLCISLTFWCRYLEKEEKKFGHIALLMWVLALLGYEYIVTYTPLYALLYFLKRDKSKRRMIDWIKQSFFPCFIGVLYLVGTFALQKMVGGDYSGSTIEFVSIASTLKIIETLVLSSLPGYFLTNEKYQYLIYLFTGEKYKNLLNVLKEPSLVVENSLIKREMVDFGIEYILNPRAIILALITCLILFLLFRIEKPVRKKAHLQMICTIFFTGCYIVIPILPNSIAKLYQGTVSDTSFTSLPVSSVVYFTICFLLSYCFCLLVDYFRRNKVFILVISILLSILMFFIQCENDVISKEQEKNYLRLVKIEKLFETDYFKNMDNSIIYSQDIFETRNLLAIHDSYWNDYAKALGLNVEIQKEKTTEVDYKLYFTDDNYFSIVGQEEIVVLSLEKLPDYFKLQVDDHEYHLAVAEDYSYDSGFLCYRFAKQDF